MGRDTAKESRESNNKAEERKKPKIESVPIMDKTEGEEGTLKNGR